MSKTTDPHGVENVKLCTSYIQKLYSVYRQTLELEKTLSDIKNFIKILPQSTKVKNATETFRKYIEESSTPTLKPDAHKYATSSDTEAIWKLRVDYKTAFALEWKAMIDPGNMDSPSDLNDRKLIFLERLADIQVESITQNRPFISAMGVFGRICVSEVFHLKLAGSEIENLLGTLSIYSDESTEGTDVSTTAKDEEKKLTGNEEHEPVS